MILFLILLILFILIIYVGLLVYIYDNYGFKVMMVNGICIAAYLSLILYLYERFK